MDIRVNLPPGVSLRIREADNRDLLTLIGDTGEYTLVDDMTLDEAKSLIAMLVTEVCRLQDEVSFFQNLAESR